MANRGLRTFCLIPLRASWSSTTTRQGKAHSSGSCIAIAIFKVSFRVKPFETSILIYLISEAWQTTLKCNLIWLQFSHNVG